MQRVLMSNYYIDSKGQGFFYAFNFTSSGRNVAIGSTSSNTDIPVGLSDSLNVNSLKVPDFEMYLTILKQLTNEKYI